ncbi:hypothetical protein [Moheibacter stercoris]|uniref:Uncharacterized protein n=1 Tax=Moheibacter stercoris TaxID=1628251 RepID=A0ABV2LT85_9FLAO
MDTEYQFFPKKELKEGRKLMVFSIMEGANEKYFEGNFYTDDLKVLNKMKNQWKLNKRSDIMPCGYTHKLVFADEYRTLNEIEINLECEYASGWIYFPKEYLLKYESKFKKLSSEE